MRAILAGGGTGGHVIPAIAIARELQARYHAEVLFIGTPRGMENRMVPAAGFPLKLVQIGALKNVSIATRLKTMFDLPRAILAARRMILGFKPDVVIGVGGYASGPAMVAAIQRGVPTIAFEPNYVAGFANRVVARWVKGAATQFAETAKRFPNGQVTGVPVREAFFSIHPTPWATPKTVLITGGSQGSRPINRAVWAAMVELKKYVPDLQVIHQTGEKDVEEARAAYAEAGVSAEATAFIEDMPSAFAHAHVVICRSGAGTVAEVAAAGRAAIFIPYPHAADDHQTRNAEALAEQGAAVLLPQSQMTPLRLVQEVRDLLTDEAHCRQMAEAAKRCGLPGAAAKIAALAAEAAGIK
ncbi:MAG: undecaprenyldiphospho-muramoylpentapeptide beta-N-acetylglucosaminyltransferase [Acidobacteriales bacterium]|nr:undecaprenyldiphospho-muramoylpentapeptide beta-N-acetylglucosaminyltransferase [Terriglobales bacterium]